MVKTERDCAVKQVLGSAWPLLLGILLLMVGNGMQGSLMGIRGAIESFSTTQLSIVSSGYFIGILIGSRISPEMIRRVGHVRVFAALGSFISAAMILFPAVTEVWVWFMLRVILGLSFSGVYVVAESWLNNAADNKHRGQALSLYMIAQMMGIVAGQAILNLADPAGFILFVIPSVLVSIAFAPILLSASPTPAFTTTKGMTLRELFVVSPTGIVGMCCVGMAFGALFGMGAIWGAQAGLSVAEISLFISAIFLGGMVLQLPIGWLSDRMDRRILILLCALAGAAAGLLGWIGGSSFTVILIAGFILGGTSNPLYSLLIAYTNDYLESDDMAAASGGLIFATGIGSICGPMLTGWTLGTLGPSGYWLYLALVMAALAAYVLYRMTQRQSIYAEEDDYDAVSYAMVSPTASAVAVELAQEVFAENAETDDEYVNVSENDTKRENEPLD